MRSSTHEAGATVRPGAVGGSDTASEAKLAALATSAAVRSKASVFLLGMGGPPFWGRRTSSTAAMVRRNVEQTETGTGYPVGPQSTTASSGTKVIGSPYCLLTSHSDFFRKCFLWPVGQSCSTAMV